LPVRKIDDTLKIRRSTSPPAWTLYSLPRSHPPRPFHASLVPSPIIVLLLSTLLLILPHPHLHPHNPCITYRFPSDLSIVFVNLIIFASEIENGIAKVDDPPHKPDMNALLGNCFVAYTRLPGGFIRDGSGARPPLTRHPTTIALLWSRTLTERTTGHTDSTL